jgi:hypothetical protein
MLAPASQKIQIAPHENHVRHRRVDPSRLLPEGVPHREEQVSSIPPDSPGQSPPPCKIVE